MSNIKPIIIKCTIETRSNPAFICPYTVIDPIYIQIESSDFKTHYANINGYAIVSYRDMLVKVIDECDYDTFVFLIEVYESKSTGLRIDNIMMSIFIHIAKSSDRRYLHYFLTNNDRDTMPIILGMVAGCGSNDELFESYLVVYNHIKLLKLHVVDPALTINTVEKNNYKILSHYLERNTDICYCKNIVSCTLNGNYEYADLFLKFHTTSLKCDTSTSLDWKSPTLKNVQYLHQLYIDDRVDLHPQIIIRIITRSIDPAVVVYTLTVFHDIECKLSEDKIEVAYRGSAGSKFTSENFISIIKEYVDEITMENEELMAMTDLN